MDFDGMGKLLVITGAAVLVLGLIFVIAGRSSSLRRSAAIRHPALWR